MQSQPAHNHLKLLLPTRQRGYADLKELPTGIRIPFIHPENIVVTAGRVSMLHFGLRNLLVPETFDHDLFLSQYKALVLHIFNPQIPYEQLIRGHVALKDATSQKIRECDSVDKIADFITTLTSQKLAEITKHSVNVPKVRYRLFKYAAIVTTVIAAVSGGFTVSAYASRIPQQEAIIAAQSDFQSNNYEQVLSDLKSYNPAKLPKSARYVLAVSAINLADLTGDQKSVVLNTISTKTDDNTLNYWAYMGRGDFEQALNLAENLGDDQLILQAYLDLYQVTKLNSQMDGSKKQQLLSDYKSKINELTKKLKSK